MVTDYLMDGNTVMWDISLCREVQDRELDELLAFLAKYMLCGAWEDSLRYILAANEAF